MLCTEIFFFFFLRGLAVKRVVFQENSQYGNVVCGDRAVMQKVLVSARLFRKKRNVVLNSFHFYIGQNRYRHGKTSG